MKFGFAIIPNGKVFLYCKFPTIEYTGMLLYNSFDSKINVHMHQFVKKKNQSLLFPHYLIVNTDAVSGLDVVRSDQPFGGHQHQM